MREWQGGPQFWNLIENNTKPLGQVVHMVDFAQYKGYDLTHLNQSKTGALPVGDFASLEEAQRAVEAALEKGISA